MGTSERSAADVLRDIVANVQTIVRSEVRLARAELRDDIAKRKAAAIWIAGGAAAGLIATAVLVLALVEGLTLVMPRWAAALTVGVVLAVAGGVSLNAGLTRLTNLDPPLDATRRSVKDNLAWAKPHVK